MKKRVADLTVHETTRALFKPDASLVDSLAKSIGEEGMAVPVVVDGKKIVDGQHRWLAHKKLGLKTIETVVWAGTGSVTEFVVRVNRERRQLNGAQLDRLAARMIPQLAKEAEQRALKGKGPGDSGGRGKKKPPGKNAGGFGGARDKAAEVVGRSARSVQKARNNLDVEEGKTDESATVVAEAAKQGAAVDSGAEDKTSRAEGAVNRKRAAEKRDAEVVDDPAGPEIVQQDALEFLAGVDDRSVDLLFTDPPYMTDVKGDIREFAESWLPSALDKVKDTGRAYVFVGSYPEELHAYLGVALAYDRLTFDGVMVWEYRNTLGPKPTMTYLRNWQAILYLYGKGAPPLQEEELKKRVMVHDYAVPRPSAHKWQKPLKLAQMLVQQSTKKGDLVIDPFAGTGTLLLAATRVGRVARGSERDPEMITLAKEVCRG